jgi:ArsR family transcriptional regulator
METLLKLSGAMYDPTRVTLLAFLMKHGSCCVCEIQGSFEMTQSRLSRHLKILQDAGFLSSQRKKQWIHYAINETLSDHAQLFLEMIQKSKIDIPSKKPKCEGASS